MITCISRIRSKIDNLINHYHLRCIPISEQSKRLKSIRRSLDQYRSIIEMQEIKDKYDIIILLELYESFEREYDLITLLINTSI